MLKAFRLTIIDSMKRWLKIFLIIIAVVIVGFLGMAIGFSYPVTQAEMNQQFITASPFDLSQIAAFSQYRSCAGHDYRAPAVATGKMEATPRSMKHYVKVKPEFRGTMDKVAAFAPFDGVISVIDDDFGGPGDQQIWLTPDTETPWSPRQWQFIFFHLNLADGLTKGSAIKAGQQIGAANLARGPESSTDNFDIAMKFTRPKHRPAIDAVFSHAIPAVLAEYEKYGIIASDLIIPEAVRDANDCPILPPGQGGHGPDVYFRHEAGSSEYIFLKTPARE